MDSRIHDLSEYFLEKAVHCIHAAKVDIKEDEYEAAANRSYYAFFNCMRAILALDEVNYRKHSAVIGHFRREYIKTKIFDTKYSDMIGDAFALRGDSDYEEFYVVPKKKVEMQIENAQKFYDVVADYLKQREE